MTIHLQGTGEEKTRALAAIRDDASGDDLATTARPPASDVFPGEGNMQPFDSVRKRQFARLGIFWATITLAIVYGVVAFTMAAFQYTNPVEGMDTFIYTAVSGMTLLVALMLIWVYTYDTSVANPPFDMTCPDGYTASEKDGDLLCTKKDASKVQPFDGELKNLMLANADGESRKIQCDSVNMSALRNIQSAKNMADGGRTPNWARCTVRSKCGDMTWSSIGGC